MFGKILPKLQFIEYIILGIMGEICDYITRKFMGTAKKNNTQVYEHNGLTPSK